MCSSSFAAIKTRVASRGAAGMAHALLPGKRWPPGATWSACPCRSSPPLQTEPPPHARTPAPHSCNPAYQPLAIQTGHWGQSMHAPSGKYTLCSSHATPRRHACMPATTLSPVDVQQQEGLAHALKLDFHRIWEGGADHLCRLPCHSDGGRSIRRLRDDSHGTRVNCTRSMQARCAGVPLGRRSITQTALKDPALGRARGRQGPPKDCGSSD